MDFDSRYEGGGKSGSSRTPGEVNDKNDYQTETGEG